MQADEVVERCIYPPKVFTGNNVEEDYELYTDAMIMKKVGDVVVQYASAPGIGCIIYKITKMDETGVYAIELSNTIRELDPSEVE